MFCSAIRVREWKRPLTRAWFLSISPTHWLIHSLTDLFHLLTEWSEKERERRCLEGKGVLFSMHELFSARISLSLTTFFSLWSFTLWENIVRICTTSMWTWPTTTSPTSTSIYRRHRSLLSLSLSLTFSFQTFIHMAHESEPLSHDSSHPLLLSPFSLIGMVIVEESFLSQVMNLGWNWRTIV